MKLFNILALASLSAASPLTAAPAADGTTFAKRVENTSSRYPHLTDGQKYGFGPLRLLISGIKMFRGSDRTGPSDADIATEFAEGFANRVRQLGSTALIQPGFSEEINVSVGHAYLASSVRPAGQKNFPLGLLADKDINSQLIWIAGAYFSLIEGIQKEVQFTMRLLNDKDVSQGEGIFTLELI